MRKRTLAILLPILLMIGCVITNVPDNNNQDGINPPLNTLDFSEFQPMVMPTNNTEAVQTNSLSE